MSKIPTQTTIPHLYLGTMTFGWSQVSSKVTESIALQMMNRFVDFQTKQSTKKVQINIDSARIYAGGKTETILGQTLSKLNVSPTATASSIVCIGTKAHPSQPHGLSRKGLQTQI